MASTKRGKAKPLRGRRQFLAGCGGALLGLGLGLYRQPSAQAATAPPAGGLKVMQLIQRQVLEKGYGERLAFAEDGRHWATARPGLLNLWEGEEVVASWEVSAQGLSFTRDSRLLLASPEIIDVKSRKQEPLPPPLQSPTKATQASYEVVSSALTPDGKQLLVMAVSRAARGIGTSSERQESQALLLDARTRRVERTLSKGGEARCQVAAASGKYLVAADSEVFVWPRAGGKGRVLHGPEHSVTGLALHEEQGWLLTVDAGGMATAWKVPSFQRIARWQAQDDNTPQLALHPHKPVAATGGNGIVKLWSVEPTPRLLGSAPLADKAIIEGLAFDPKGERLVVAVGGKLLIFAVQ